ncbi:tape measure protein [Hydrogenophaga defluvii]|uniref:Tape measure protein n=1 Tax=Hydrogenophaga defluvii TaxID=249410 RepID=A0ABW2S911_9BURK
MAIKPIEILIKARDEASAVFKSLGGNASKSTDQIGISAEAVGGALTKLAASIAAGFTLSSLTEAADAYNNLASRIKLATGEGAAFTEAMAGVEQVAVDTRSSLEATGTLFTRIAQAGKDLGVSQREALDLTRTINQAIQLSGASATASDAAITQLIQGLQSGVLRGEEFNSVMEQAPRLAQALAAGLQVPIGDLRKLAEQGQLTSDTVIRALRGQSDTVASEFAKLSPTVGGALTNLSTAWTVYVGNVDKATGASRSASDAINFLAKNLETVAGILIDVGQAAAAFAALKLAQQFLGIGTAAKVAAVEMAAASTQIAAVGTASTAAGANVGRFTAALSTLKTFSLVAILVNAKDIGTAIGEWAAQLAGYKDRSDEIIEQERVQKSILEENNKLRQRQRDLDLANRDSTLEIGKAARASLTEFEKLTKEGKSSSDAINTIGKDFDLSTLPGIKNAATVLDELKRTGQITAEQFQAAWAKALDGQDLAKFQTMAMAALDQTAIGARRIAEVMDVSLRTAIDRTGLDFNRISTGMSKASVSALNDIDTLIEGMDKMRAQGIDVGKVLEASISNGIKTAQSQKELEALRDRVKEVRDQLGDKVADSFLKQIEGELQKLDPKFKELQESFARLGIKMRDDSEATASQLRRDYEKAAYSGKASAEELTKAWIKMAETQIRENGGVVSDLLRTEAAARGLAISFDDVGRASITAATSAAQGWVNTNKTLAETETYLDRIAKRNADVKSQLQGTAYNAEGFALDSSGGVLQMAMPDTYVPNFLPNGKRNVDYLNQGEIMQRVSSGAGFEATAAIGLPAPSSGTQAVGGTVQPVNININGARSTVNVASASDAAALEGVLRQLTNDAART